MRVGICWNWECCQVSPVKDHHCMNCGGLTELGYRAQAIREARDDARLTQRQSAKLVHVSLRAWQSWEAAERLAPLGALELYKLKTDDPYRVLELPELPDGEILRGYRLSRGLSINECCDLLAVKYPTYWAWENRGAAMPLWAWELLHLKMGFSHP